MDLSVKEDDGRINGHDLLFSHLFLEQQSFFECPQFKRAKHNLAFFVNVAMNGCSMGGIDSI